MRHYAKVAALVVACLCACGSRAHAQFGKAGSSTAGHDHSTLNQGGPTISPRALTLVAGSTVTPGGLFYNMERCYTSTTAISGKDASITISVLSSSVSYRFEAEGVNTNAADIYLRFNGDSGANYQCQNLYQVNAGAQTLCSSGSVGWTASYNSLIGAAASAAASGSWNFVGRIKTEYGSPKKMIPHGTGCYKHTVAANMWACGNFGGDYNGAANLSSITLGVSAGTFAGRLTVCEMVSSTP